MSEETIASAIGVPEPTDSPVTNSTLKRRASELHEHEQDGKRQRMSSGKTTPPTNATPDAESRERSQPAPGEASKVVDKPPGEPSEARRKSSVVEEKQRSKRLFGALLGNLNQPGDRTTKRRQEVEERRKAELRRQDERDAQDQRQKQGRLAERWRMEKIHIDERNMRVRHRHMLDTANYLQTRSGPRIYYRPWDLRPDEEDRIDDQIRDAQAQIDKELEDFKRRSDQADGESVHDKNTRKKDEHDRPRDSRADGIPKQPETLEDAPRKDNEQPVLVSEGQPQAAHVPDMSTPDTTDAATNTNAPHRAGSADKGESIENVREQVEEDEDHVVQGDEDTVIY